MWLRWVQRLGDTGGSPSAQIQMASRTTIALSPDATRLALAGWQDGDQRLYLRSLDRPEADPIAGTEGALNPFFSPDGDLVGFWANGQLQKVALAGGLPLPICDTTVIYGASWTADDHIAFAQQSGGLWSVFAQGGIPAVLTEPGGEGGTSHRLPWVRPNEAVLFTAVNATRNWDDAAVVVESLVTGKRQVLLEDAAHPMYASSGHLLFIRSRVLWAAPFDATTLEVTGNTTAPMLQFPGAWSPAGELIYIEDHPVRRADILSIDPFEPERGSRAVVAGPSNEAYPALSLNGRWLAYASDQSGQYEVFVVAYPESDGGEQVSSGGGYMPTWSPNGDELFYIRRASGEQPDDWVMQVSVSLESGFQAQSPKELFAFPYQDSDFMRTYDVAPDGSFVMVERGTGPRAQADTTPRIIFIWQSELERLIPTRVVPTR